MNLKRAGGARGAPNDVGVEREARRIEVCAFDPGVDLLGGEAEISTDPSHSVQGFG